MPNSAQYCCEDLKYAVDGGCFHGWPAVILYQPEYRSYGLVVDGNHDDQFIFEYCPFCGKKLPKNLTDEHFDAIRDENGKPLEPIPEEFQTDEWWKKRGL
jgi:hypothetical protein